MINGPCELCGAMGYSLSMGGPGICPACDAGGAANGYRVRFQTAVADTREACAKYLDNLAESAYGSDLFPDDSTSEAAKRAKWARALFHGAAKDIRDGKSV